MFCAVYGYGELIQIADGYEAVGEAPEGGCLAIDDIGEIFVMDGTDLGGVIYTDVVIAVAVLITDIEGGFFTGIAVSVGDFQGALRIFEAVGGHIFTVVFHISDPADIGDILLHAAKGGQVGELGHAVVSGDGALIVSGHSQYVGIICFLHIKFAHGGRFDGREGFVGSQCLDTAGKMAVEGGFGQVDFLFHRYFQLNLIEYCIWTVIL